MTNDLPRSSRETPGRTSSGATSGALLWGFGGLTFGLTMRYLGMSLGMAMVLGYCAAFGTLMPPIFDGVFASSVLRHRFGTGDPAAASPSAWAASHSPARPAFPKRREMSAEQKKEVIKEFNLKKGVLVATFSGVMSACFSYGLRAGDPIKRTDAWRHGTSTLWQGLPVLVVVLLGGFTTNFIWCVILNFAIAAAISTSAVSRDPSKSDASVPMLRNYFFSAPWPAPPGISSSSSTPWARRKWGSTNSPVGRCTWPASSSSAACGASACTNGAEPARGT